MSKKDLSELVAKKEEYDEQSQMLIDNLVFVDNEITDINSMKRTNGWKIMQKKIREELQAKINALVKDDPEVKVLLALLNVADTKTQAEMLEAEIAKVLPNA